MKKLIAVVAAAAGLAILAIAPANAAGQLCYDINVQVADQPPIAQAGCQDVPDLPTP